MSTYIGGLCGEEDDLVELGEVGQEVVGSRSLRCAPSVFNLLRNCSASASSRAYAKIAHIPAGVDEHVVEIDNESVWAIMRLGEGSGDERIPGGFVEVLCDAHRYQRPC